MSDLGIFLGAGEIVQIVLDGNCFSGVHARAFFGDQSKCVEFKIEFRERVASVREVLWFSSLGFDFKTYLDSFHNSTESTKMARHDTETNIEYFRRIHALEGHWFEIDALSLDSLHMCMIGQ